MRTNPSYHTPVLAEPTVDYLLISSEGVYLDGTLGGGGHAELILERLATTGTLIGIDRDPEAIAHAEDRLSVFGSRFTAVEGSFEDLTQILKGLNIPEISGAVLDLGISSHQIDDPRRGFSYQQSGPLEMRMGPAATRSARDVINTYSAEELTRIFRQYGEERGAGRIARAICRRRDALPLETTSDLSEVVSSIAKGPKATKTLARIFQAVRIEVNGELESLNSGLKAAVEFLKPGGRIAVLSYHSLEDRIVKQTFRAASLGCICPPDLPVCGCDQKPILRVLTKRGVKAGSAEISENPRARSATLRVAEKLQPDPAILIRFGDQE
jgi:16S rRNA (cytosine1402-N4)-methyltransferase